MTREGVSGHFRAMANQYAKSPPYARIAALMLLLAVSMAAVSALHLSGMVGGNTSGNGEMSAGIAEAVICVAMLWGVSSLVRRGAAGLGVAIGTTVFAIAGFCLGLSITASGGYIPDIAYHATVLPLLLITFALLVRGSRHGRGSGAGHEPGLDRRPLRR